MAIAADELLRRADASARGRRRHGHERQDDDGVPAALGARGRRPIDRARRHGRVGRRRRAPAGAAHDARGDRPAARSSARWSTPATERRGRGLVARLGTSGGSTACASTRSSSRTSRRITSTCTGRWRSYYQAKRRLFTGARAAAGGGERRRRVRPPARARARRVAARAARHLRADGARQRCAPTASSWGRTAAASAPPGSRSRRRCAAASTSRTCSASVAAGSCSTSTTTRSRRAFARCTGVPGRFEAVDEGQPFAVIVDYAHTPDSLDIVLQAARGARRRPARSASSAPAATATAASGP